MNLASIFKEQSKVGGVHVSDESIKFFLIEKRKNTPLSESINFHSINLPKELIISGEIKDPGKLTVLLKQARREINSKFEYIMLSLPTEVFYSKTYNYPRSLQGEKLVDVMKLNISMQLPFPESESSASWEITENEDQLKVFLAACKKNILEQHLTCFKAAGFKIVAIEPEGVSLSRLLDAKTPNNIILYNTLGTKLTSWLFSKNKLFFARSSAIPGTKTTNSQKIEVEKLENYAESELSSVSTFALSAFKFPDSIDSILKTKKLNSEWAFVLGAALRGVEDQKTDTGISLLPLRPNEAFKYQKITSFAGLMSNVVIGVSIFFVCAYLAGWLFIASIQARTSITIDSFPGNPGDANIEEQVKELNALSSYGVLINSSTRNWSEIISEIREKSTDQVKITNVSFSGDSDLITLNGLAKSRSDINIYRKKLETSAIFTEVKLPLTNLEQKGDIPFTVSFKIKNPVSR